MNWFQRLSADWRARKEDAGQHLHLTFSNMFPIAPNKESVLDIVDPGIVHYLPSPVDRYRRGGMERLGLDPRKTHEFWTCYFTGNDRLYRLDVPVGMSNAISMMSSPENKSNFLQQGIMGVLERIFDRHGQPQVRATHIATIKSDSPYSFAQEVKTYIQSDRNDDNSDEDPVDTGPPLVPHRVPALAH